MIAAILCDLVGFNIMKRFITYMLVVAISFSPLHGYMTPVYAKENSYSAEAEKWTESFASDLWDNSNTDSNSSVSIGKGDTRIEGELSEIFPGLKDGDNAAPSDSPSTASLGAASQDDDLVKSLGANAKSGLYDDAIKDDDIKGDPGELNHPDDKPWSDSNVAQAESTKYGVAYDIIREDSQRQYVDLTNDPMLNNYRQAKENAPVFEENFFDCSSDTSLVDNSRTVHIPEYKMCNRLYKPDGACRITHEITIGTDPADIVFLVDNSASMDDEIASLRKNIKYFAQLLEQGDSDNLRLGGAAYRNNDYKWNNTKLSKNINNFQRWIDGVKTKGAWTQTATVSNWAFSHFNWRNTTDEGEPVRKVIIAIGNDDGPGMNPNTVRSRGKKEGIDIFLFHNNGNTNRLGSKIANHFSGSKLIEFAKFFTVVNDTWTPQGCINDAIASLEEFCEGSYTPKPSNNEQCRKISMFTVCKGDHIYDQLVEPPVPNVPKLSSHVDVSALQCDFNHGSASCWTDPQGEQHCLENYEDLADQECRDLEDDPQCGFISQECVDNAEGSWGNCYVTEEKFDCGEDVKIDSSKSETTYQCDGDFQCVGADCFDTAVEENEDFAKVSAILNVAQQAQQEMECELDGNGATSANCTIFQGDDMECKTAVGGAQDCCDQPVGVNAADYLTMILAMPKLDSAIKSAQLTDGSALDVARSGYEALRDPVVNSVSEVTQPFTNYLDSATAEIQKSMTKAFDSVMNKVKEKAAEVMEKVIGAVTQDPNMAAQAGQQAGAELGKKTVKDKAAQEGAGQAAGQVMMNVGTTIVAIYGYYQMAMMAIKMIWKCEQEEFMLASQRELGNCHHVGSYCKTEVLGWCVEKRRSYCCFKSPLSRIMNEQIRKNTGLGWGDAENPQCAGIPLDQINSIDWDKVNLDEWTAILQKEGLYQGAEGNVNVEALTGSGSLMPGQVDGGSRTNVIDRTEQRADGLDMEGKRKEATESFVPEVD